MAEYIDRGTAIAKLTALEVSKPNATMVAAKRLLAEIPVADVVPVVHGRKIEDGDIGCFWLCSLCSECLPYGANYCPNCGAKMDGRGEK